MSGITTTRHLFVTLLMLATAATAQTYRVNCGGSGYGDPFGRSWSGDRTYSAAAGFGAIGGYTSMPYPSYIYQGGTPMPNLYWRGRYDHSEYRFDVATGSYTVTLRFGERQLHGAGLRRQSVFAEGVAVLTQLDIAAVVGKDYALDHAFRVDVSDGQLNLAFTAQLGETMVSAISVVPTPTDATGPPPPSAAAYGVFEANLVYWDQGTTADLAGYQVLRSSSPGGPFALVSDPIVYHRRFIDRAAPLGVPSYYVVQGVDVFGNVGSPTSPLTAIPLAEADSQARIYDLDISPMDELFLNSNPQTDTYVPANFSYGAYTASIASTRYRGNIGRRYSKKSFNIQLFGLPLEGREKIALKAVFGDRTILREKLCYDLHALVNVPTPVERFVHLHVNGAHRGVFCETETHGEVFLDHHRMAENADLWKTNWGADLFQEPSMAEYMRLYEKKTNIDTGWGVLVDLVDTLTTEPAATLDVALGARVDIQRWLDYYAMTVLVADRDSTYHNFWLYRNTTSGLFTMLPWDRDISWYNSNLPIDAGTVSAGSTIGGPNQLITRVLQVPLYRTLYVEKLQEILADHFTQTGIDAILARAYGDMITDGKADWTKRDWESNSAVIAGMSSLSNTAASRIAYINGRIPGFTTPIQRDVLINEVQARNTNTLADGAGDFDDWIELHNRGGAPVDLTGWHLSDDALDPTMWKIPAGTMIPPGGFLLVWADDEPLEGPLHASFQLDGDGDKVFLWHSLALGGDLVDLVATDRVRADHSYGRKYDGGALWYELRVPTPGAPSSCALDLAPVIWGDSLDPCVPAAGAPVTVRVMTEDDAGDTAAVDLTHDIGGGAATVPMADDGLAPDLQADDDEWTAVLPAAPQQTIVRYWFSATDGAGNTIAEPDRAPIRTLAYGIPAWTGDILINEVCADNESVIADPAGDFDDWIELYNASPGIVDLSGMFLTDDLDDSTRWAIPVGTTLAPGGFLLIWADNEPGEGPLHATLQISSHGESVALFDSFASGNALLDVITFCRQAPDDSVGRTWDGGSTVAVLRPPTPGASNGPVPPCVTITCGDCDLDGDIDILDALAAARHSLGIITLTGAAFANCDVTAGASAMPISVDVLDALLVAQWAAGLPVTLDCCP